MPEAGWGVAVGSSGAVSRRSPVVLGDEWRDRRAHRFRDPAKQAHLRPSSADPPPPNLSFRRTKCVGSQAGALYRLDSIDDRCVSLGPGRSNVLHEGRWTVRRDGKTYGPYPSREAALTSAIGAAHMSGQNDRAAQVLSQGEDGETQVEWTYGVDLDPPQDAPGGRTRSRYPAGNLDWPVIEGWSGLASTALLWSRSWAPF